MSHLQYRAFHFSLQAGFISSSDAATRAQKYSLLACAWFSCLMQLLFDFSRFANVGVSPYPYMSSFVLLQHASLLTHSQGFLQAFAVQFTLTQH
jgi:hypothetical protein